MLKMFAAKTTPLPPEVAVFRFAENSICQCVIGLDRRRMSIRTIHLLIEGYSDRASGP